MPVDLQSPDGMVTFSVLLAQLQAEFDRAEQRGFDRAVALIEAGLRQEDGQDEGGIYLSCWRKEERDTELQITVSLVTNDCDEIEGPKRPFSEVLLQQYPNCLGSTRDLAAALRLSLENVEAAIVQKAAQKAA